MKVVLFVSALSGGGAERVVCNLANYLSDCGHDVEILTMAEVEAVEELRPAIKNLPLLKRNERRNVVIDNVKRIFRLRKYMKKQMIDAYVVMLPIPTQLMLRFSKLTKAPIIVSERADPKAYSMKTQKRLQKLASKASGFVFQTAEAAAWYEPYLKGVPYQIIPNAINPAFIRPTYEGVREKKIVAAGRLAEQKNFALLIRAFAKISSKYPEHQLVIYGKGSLESSLKELANELSIADRVEFPGYVDNMPEVLEKASMFVLSSNYEGMPNALMEAMALGLPCVSTDCGGGGAKFLIQNGENGLLVPQKDEDALADAMEKILSDNAFSSALGEKARKLQETLAPGKIYGEWESFLKEFVN